MLPHIVRAAMAPGAASAHRRSTRSAPGSCTPRRSSEECERPSHARPCNQIAKTRDLGRYSHRRGSIGSRRDAALWTTGTRCETQPIPTCRANRSRTAHNLPVRSLTPPRAGITVTTAPPRATCMSNRRFPLLLATLASLVVAVAMMSDTLSSQAQRRGRSTATTFIDGREAIDGEVIVGYRSAVGAIERERAEFQADAEEVEPINRHGARRIRSRRLNTRELLQTLQANPDVDFAEPNYVVRVGAVPDDPSFGTLWGLLNTGQTIGSGTGIPGADIGAVAAWDVTTGSQSTVVGIVDTGIDYPHPDLAANIWAAPRAFSVTLGDLVITCAAGSHGFNAITNTCNPFDDHSHGTHVAGTIGAVGNNAVGVTGVNWTASMMGLKFLDANGGGTLADAIKVIEFAIQAKVALGADANIRILSNSWSGGGFSQALRNQIE